MVNATSAASVRKPVQPVKPAEAIYNGNVTCVTGVERFARRMLLIILESKMRKMKGRSL